MRNEMRLYESLTNRERIIDQTSDGQSGHVARNHDIVRNSSRLAQPCSKRSALAPPPLGLIRYDRPAKCPPVGTVLILVPRRDNFQSPRTMGVCCRLPTFRLFSNGFG